MGWVRTTAVVVAGAAVAGQAGAQSSRQQVTGPVATYWMSASTTSGFGAAMAGAQSGKRPSMGAMMGMMMGGGSNVGHSLSLQLGSSRRPMGDAKAEHLPPAGMGVGQSLPLLTPKAQPAQRVDEAPAIPREYQKPKGRMLIFWGCGERAKAGQPVVIDFAQISEGRMPAGLEALTRGLNVTPMQPPSPGRNATYGEWPNEKTRTSVPATGSLVGDHLVRGSYTPEIRFALSASQDFLPPLSFTVKDVTPTGSARLGWTPIQGASAYLATAIGAGQQDTVVLWTSSEVQASAFSLPDYLSTPDISRLVGAKALLPAQARGCTIPQEVVKAAPQALVQLAAYGQEVNFSYPPRPSDPKAPWNIDWSVKVRYKSQTAALLGVDMPGAGGRRGQQQQPAQPPSVGGAILRGLGGKIPGL